MPGPLNDEADLEKLAGLLLLAVGCCATARAAPLTILVSIDGMRPDYLERGVTPNLNRLAAGGARAVAMRPSFPSITFPNHYTLVTGLRPDHHGVVDNNMEDAAIHGVRPTVAPQFDGKLPASGRTERLLSWLGRTDVEPLGFATLYFDDVDHAGHTYGPAAEQTTAAVAIRLDFTSSATFSPSGHNDAGGALENAFTKVTHWPMPTTSF